MVIYMINTLLVVSQIQLSNKVKPFLVAKKYVMPLINIFMQYLLILQQVNVDKIRRSY